MGVFSCPLLERCLESYPDANTAGLIRTRLAQAGDLAALLPLYDQAIPVLEAAMWESALAPLRVADCHAIAAAGDDPRHAFVVVVPVADRPQHLRTCLESLAGAAQAFHYGAGKVMAVIADDSRDAANITENKTIAEAIRQAGVEVIYFGQDEQLAELDALAASERQGLQNIIGTAAPDAFSHKGASITRNITYLMLNRMAQDDKNRLFMFVDSDQEFHANTGTSRRVFTTNYFYHIDRIFRESRAEVLTGKVVGDPPVSPAVMAGTLLEDVLAFLTEISGLEADTPCTFHRDTSSNEGAAYHDMAVLFGFEHSGEAHRFQCRLQGPHNNAACLTGFADRLNHFFNGEHPTRVTPYQHTDVQDSVTAARTVYTGNYVLSPGALKYFIPFAGLQLRMAGPVLGRLVQASSGKNFVSANLPMLHRRSVEEKGGSGFRPGVDRSAPVVDLSGEFERQFFGDVMLFTVIDLVEQGYPGKLLLSADIRAQVMATENRMREQYMEMQQRVMTRLDDLEALLSDDGRWWNNDQYAGSRTRFGQFTAALRANFGTDARAWQLIDDEAHREARRAAIVDALSSYRLDRQSWEQALQK